MCKEQLTNYNFNETGSAGSPNDDKPVIYEIILMDFSMPKMDGPTAVKEIIKILDLHE